MEIGYTDKKVLIVDNRLEDLSELKDILERMGVAAVQLASSVNMGLALLREERYDICFVTFDLGKDQKNGLQLIQEATAEGCRQYSTVFILIVDPERSKLLFGSLDSAPDTYISKPFAEAKVRYRVEKILRIKSVLQPLESLLDSGDFQGALDMCMRLLQEYPGLNMYIQRIRGIILIELGLYAEAQHLFDALIAQRDLPWAQVGLGLAYCHMGEYKAAQRYLTRVIDDSHFCVEAYSWLARSFQAIGERGEAVSLLRKAIMLQSTVPQLHGVLGSLASQNKEWPLAIDAYRAAIKYARHSCFQSDDFYFGLVGALLSRVNGSGSADVVEAEQEAVRVLEDVVGAFPGEPLIQFKSRLMAATIYRTAGSVQRANLAAQNAFDLFCNLQLTEQAEWLDPMMEGMEGTEVEAEAQALRQQINRDMARLEWGKLNIQGMLCYRKKEYRKALGFFVRADGLLPNNPSVVLNLIQAALEQARSPGMEQQELLLQCDNALYSINFGALSSRQQNRYLMLYEKCSGLVRVLLERKEVRARKT